MERLLSNHSGFLEYKPSPLPCQALCYGGGTASKMLLHLVANCQGCGCHGNASRTQLLGDGIPCHGKRVECLRAAGEGRAPVYMYTLVWEVCLCVVFQKRKVAINETFVV